MARGDQKLNLGESWVVEGDESSPSDEDYMPQSTTPSRRSTRASERSPEPQLVMPSLDSESMDGSWAPTASRTMRPQGPRITDKETRRRVARVNKDGLKTQTASKPRTRSSQLPQRSRYNDERSSTQEILDIAMKQSRTLMDWLLDIVWGALSMLKTPIKIMLAAVLLFGTLKYARDSMMGSFYSTLSPICSLPGVSFLRLPICPTQHVGSPQFDDLMKVQSKFEEVLEESANSASLPLDMKRGEASIRDLRQLVSFSHLQSRNELVLEFDGFVETARMASYDLQRFNSHVGRAVDSVISTTRWTTRVLDGIEERDVTRGSVNAFINDKLLAPFQPIKFTETMLLDQYIQHTRLVEEEISKLITEAQTLLMVLTNLEDRLDIIHGIAIREDMHTQVQKDQILSELWTMFGGNRGKLDKMDKQLNLLRKVDMYRKNAIAHVSGTLVRLQAIGAGLEDLRERVATPELLRDRVNIPLSVHLDNIKQGVERLEESRQNARKLEDQHVKQTLARGKQEGTLIDG